MGRFGWIVVFCVLVSSAMAQPGPSGQTAKLKKELAAAHHTIDALLRANKAVIGQQAEMDRRYSREIAGLQVRLQAALEEQRRIINRDTDIVYLMRATAEYHDRQLETAVADETMLNGLGQIGSPPDLVGRFRRSLKERQEAEERLARAVKRVEALEPKSTE